MIAGRGEVEQHGVDPMTVWRVMNVACGDLVVRGDEQWPGALLPPMRACQWNEEEIKDLRQKVCSDVWPRCDHKLVEVVTQYSRYARLSFGKEVLGSMCSSRSASGRYVLAYRDGRVWPAQVLFYCKLVVDKRTAGGEVRRHTLSFCKVDWFERKQQKGPDGRDSLYYAEHMTSRGWKQYIPIQRIVQRFAPGFSADGFTFYVCPIPRRVHL